MIIFPAIDLYEKKAVRLFKGDYEKMTVYSDNPLSVAKDFESSGAEFIHMVDLEGAKDGTTPNFKTVSEIANKCKLKVEIGGGIRSEETVKRYLDAGVFRVILGTAAVQNPEFLADMVSKYKDSIAVGADIKDGMAAVNGWTQTSGLTCGELCKELESIGVKTVICTDISRDGAMKGTNREMYKRLNSAYNIDFIASGGVSSLDDIKALKSSGMYGAIIGKAYYTGAIDIAEAIEVAK